MILTEKDKEILLNNGWRWRRNLEDNNNPNWFEKEHAFLFTRNSSDITWEQGSYFNCIVVNFFSIGGEMRFTSFEEALVAAEIME